MALSYIAPSPELAVELSEVRSDAAGLAEVFSQLNAPLPVDFPREAVLELTAALRELPDGTAKGCLRPLSEAQSQLAAIRSQHIRHDHPEEGWDLDRPPLFRGEPIDQRLRSLMSSVSTALQTANRLAAEEPELETPEVETEPPKDSTTSKLIERSTKAQRELEGEKQELASLRIDTEPADTLSRRLTDTVVLNRLVRGELRLPRVVSARLRRIASALRDYPLLLQKAAEIVSAGTRLADYAHEKWSELETRIFTVGTSSIREIADDVSSYAKKLELQRKGGDPLQEKPPADFDLNEAARMIHAGKAPPAAWKPFIDFLPLGNRRLKSLRPLEGLTKLKSFRKASVKLNDISAATTLTSLTYLDLSLTGVSDVAPLGNLQKLVSLNLNNTAVADIRPLATVSALQDLKLRRTPVSDLTPLSNLSNIEILELANTRVSDLTPLRSLQALLSLDLSNTKARDVTPLQALSNLRLLNLAGTATEDIQALCNLWAIESLDLSNTAVASLNGLQDLKKLQYLNISRTLVSDLAELKQLLALRTLYLKQTRVSDLRPLRHLPLRSLDIGNTPVEDIEPLSEMNSLRTLDLLATSVADLTPILTLPGIRSLTIAGAPVRDISKVLTMPNLGFLTVDQGQRAKLPQKSGRRGVHLSVTPDKRPHP